MWMNKISIPISYEPLPDAPKLNKWRSLITLAFSFASAVTLLLAFLLLVSSARPRVLQSLPAYHLPVYNRGVSEGVSVKSTGVFSSSDTPYPWTNNMLSWQRTGFHFQPQQNWMNDPDAPLLYKGWYHLFYQYNPESAVWGNITWGHAVSRDLINWRYLPLSMVPDHWYDINGVWTGSATVLPNDQIFILYTGSTNTSIQVQNLAVPADPSDPLLIEWIKYDANPVLVPPPGIEPKDFRDPTSAWYVESTLSWRVAIGSKNSVDAGIVLVYETKDFLDYKLIPSVLHEVAGTGMWECVDFYPIGTEEDGVKHVLKASLDDDKHDYYGIGVYDSKKELWVPDNPNMDVGVGLRLDYGKYYASKSFYDGQKRRRVVWGWTGETDSESADLIKGWASLQTIPRTISFDSKTKNNLIQWPVEEVENLRLSLQERANITLPHGSFLPIDIKYADQLDITAEFQIESSASFETINEADVGYNCSTSNGSRERGLLGPFGLLVLADDDLNEHTAVYFYIARGRDGSFQTFFCQDELRSSKANDIVKRVYGSVVPVLDGENLHVRILVDHSIVESFAQKGRTCITSRVYPTRAIYGAARVFLFNNATNSDVLVRTLKIWQMKSASIRPYMEDEDHKTY